MGEVCKLGIYREIGHIQVLLGCLGLEEGGKEQEELQRDSYSIRQNSVVINVNYINPYKGSQ
jgi:hypothetical protein